MLYGPQHAAALETAAWSFLLNGYNAPFFEQHGGRIPQFVEAIVKNNTAARLANLIQRGSGSSPASGGSVKGSVLSAFLGVTSYI